MASAVSGVWATVKNVTKKPITNKAIFFIMAISEGVLEAIWLGNF